MKLIVFEKNGNLHFKSDGYFVDIGSWRLPIPALLSPGEVYLMHIDEGENNFQISIEITHRWLGRTFTQKGRFESI